MDKEPGTKEELHRFSSLETGAVFVFPSCRAEMMKLASDDWRPPINAGYYCFIETGQVHTASNDTIVVPLKAFYRVVLPKL